jgi:hypothetical protein
MRDVSGQTTGMAPGRIEHVFNDGGRSAAGYKGSTGDCVVRAIAIATCKPYTEVYDALKALAKRGEHHLA